MEEGKKTNNWHYRRLKCIIWIVTFRKGIIKFTLTKREELSAYRTSNDKPMQNRIISLYEDCMGNIRIDDNSEKTSRYKKQKKQFIIIPTKSGNAVQNIIKDSHSKIWGETFQQELDMVNSQEKPFDINLNNYYIIPLPVTTSNLIQIDTTKQQLYILLSE